MSNEQEKTIIERLEAAGVAAETATFDAPDDDWRYVVVDGEELLKLLEKPKRKRTVGKPPSETAYRCSALLIEYLDGVPGATINRNSPTNWAKQIDLLFNEMSSIPIVREAEVMAAIAWVLDPKQMGGEYAIVVRSGYALRKKYPNIVAAMNRVSPAEAAEAEKQQQRAALQEKYG